MVLSWQAFTPRFAPIERRSLRVDRRRLLRPVASTAVIAPPPPGSVKRHEIDESFAKGFCQVEESVGLLQTGRLGIKSRNSLTANEYGVIHRDTIVLEDAKRKLTKNAKAICPVHYLGLSAIEGGMGNYQNGEDYERAASSGCRVGSRRLRQR
jgi:hypothetical protein